MTQSIRLTNPFTFNTFVDTSQIEATQFAIAYYDRVIGHDFNITGAGPLSHVIATTGDKWLVRHNTSDPAYTYEIDIEPPSGKRIVAAPEITHIGSFRTNGVPYSWTRPADYTNYGGITYLVTRLSNGKLRINITYTSHSRTDGVQFANTTAQTNLAMDRINAGTHTYDHLETRLTGTFFEDIPADLMPSFPQNADGTRTGTEGIELDWQLPAATGGDGALTYSLKEIGTAPAVTFNANTRTITHTFNTHGQYLYTLTATDSDGDQATLDITITIVASETIDPPLVQSGIFNAALWDEERRRRVGY